MLPTGPRIVVSEHHKSLGPTDLFKITYKVYAVHIKVSSVDHSSIKISIRIRVLLLRYATERKRECMRRGKRSSEGNFVTCVACYTFLLIVDIVKFTLEGQLHQ